MPLPDNPYLKTSANPLYRIYRGARSRSEQNHRGYEHVEFLWDDFEEFVDDLGMDWFDGASLDRIDPEGPYCTGNCRWVEQGKQQRNKRASVFVEWDGERVNLIDLCEELNVPYRRVYTRVYSQNWTLDKALSEPCNEPHSLSTYAGKARIKFGGLSKTPKEWAQALKRDWKILAGRLKAGWPVDKALMI